MTKWRFEERACPVCAASPDAATFLGYRGGAAHHQGLGSRTGIVRCPSCHAVYQRPTAIPLENPYLEHAPEEYFQHHERDPKVAAGQQLARTAEELLGFRGRMLEAGCGRGELLRGAADAGWQVAGVDMTASFAAVAAQNGVQVEVAPIESARSLEQEWDVILLAAVLEHVYEPARVLSRVAAALKRGGLVFLDVPNECSLYNRVGNAYMRLRGRDWVTNLSPTFPPFHVVGFCPRSLRRVLMASGLEPVLLSLYPTVVSVDERWSGLRARLEKSAMRATLLAGGLLGMGAGITCWARKR